MVEGGCYEVVDGLMKSRGYDGDYGHVVSHGDGGCRPVGKARERWFISCLKVCDGWWTCENGNFLRTCDEVKRGHAGLYT